MQKARLFTFRRIVGQAKELLCRRFLDRVQCSEYVEYLERYLRETERQPIEILQQYSAKWVRSSAEV